MLRAMGGIWRRISGILRREPREGDLVTVLNGTYAGRTGSVIATDASTVSVFIDECCQPRLAHEQVRREWRGRGIPGVARRARESDAAGEEARASLAIHR